MRKWLMPAAAALLCAAPASARLPKVGDVAPDFTFTLMDGSKVSRDDLKGQVVLLNFWATWCPPCVEELPMLNGFYRDHRARGWQVVGLAIDQPSAVRKFLERVPLDFPVGLAGLQGTDLGRSLGNLAGGLPFTVLFGTDGSIMHRKMGQITTEDLRQWAALG